MSLGVQPAISGVFDGSEIIGIRPQKEFLRLEARALNFCPGKLASALLLNEMSSVDPFRVRYSLILFIFKSVRVRHTFLINHDFHRKMFSLQE